MMRAAISRAAQVATAHGVPGDDLITHLAPLPAAAQLRVATGIAIDATLLHAAGRPTFHLPASRAAYWAGTTHLDGSTPAVAWTSTDAWALMPGRYSLTDLIAHPDLAVIPTSDLHARALYLHSPVELRRRDSGYWRLTLTIHYVYAAIPAA